MAIKNIHQHFLDIIKSNQKSADELADMFVHELEFNEPQAVDVIYNSTVKSLKSVGIFSKTRQSKRDASKTVTMKAFEITPQDAKEYQSTLEDLASFAYRKVFTQKNIQNVYQKYFGSGVSVDSFNTVHFPKSTYGLPQGQGKKKFRHEAQKDLTVQAVQVVLKNFAPEFREKIRNKGSYYMPRGSDVDDAKSKRFKKFQGKKDIKTRAVDSHSTRGNDTTTALLNALLNLETAVDTHIAPIVANIVDHNNIITSTRDRMLSIFSEFKIGKDSITDIVAKKAQGQKVEDIITVTLEYGTDKLNRSMSQKDRDGIEKELDKIRDEQLKQLAEDFTGDKRSSKYRQLKASPKSYDDRLEDGALNNTIDMVEGVERIAKLLKGVKVTSGRKVKAKKKQTSSKTKKQTVTKSKIKNRKAAKGVTKREKIATTGRYDPRAAASETSLAALMQIINRSLPRHLKGNMEPPALQYRGQGNPSKPFAGPFNTGVRLTSLRNLKKVQGGLQVNYTYEKYPYQTFEPGFEQGSIERDPRQLIQESIRDIMIERKQTRFLNFRRY